jgi:hypothetical protein
MPITDNLMKRKSTESSGAKGKGRSKLVQDGSLMAGGDLDAEYRFLRLQDLKAGIRDRDVAEGSARHSLKQTIRNESEQETLAHKILIKLNGLSDYSAEFAQVSSVLGTTNRVAIAQEMAQKYCDNYSTKLIMDALVPPGAGDPSGVETAFAHSGFKFKPSAWNFRPPAANAAPQQPAE